MLLATFKAAPGPGGTSDTILPTPVVGALGVVEPTLLLGGVTLTPSPVTAAWSVVAPTVLNTELLTPTAVTAAWSVVAPTLVPGGVTLTPSPVTAAWGVPTASITATPPNTVVVTVKSSGGDYTSVNAALAGEAKDITSATGSNQIIRLDLYPMEDTTRWVGGMLDSNWKTSATNYVEIRIVDSGGSPAYTATWSTSIYRLNASTSNGSVIQMAYNIGVQHLWVTAGTLQVRATGTGQAFSGNIELHHAGFARFDSGGILISELDDAVNAWRGIKYDREGTMRFRNWICYGGKAGQSHAATNMPSGGGTSEFDNCTFDQWKYGILNQDASNTMTYRNCRFTDIATSLNPTWADDGTTDGSHNLTTESSDIPSAWTNTQSSATTDYVDDNNATLTSRDYRLNSSSDDGYQNGTDLSSDFTTDIENTTRSASWDIGAHELSA